MKKFLILLFITFFLIISGVFAEGDISGLDFSSLTQENLKICSQLNSGGEKIQCYNKIFKTFGEKNETQCLSILAPGKLRSILPRGNLTIDEHYNLWNSTFGLIQKYCRDKYTQRIVYLTPKQKLEQEFDYRQKQETEKYKANPYGCFQPDSNENNKIRFAYSVGSIYVNVCKYTGMTEEEHIEGVKMFVPYLNSPAEFFDSPTLWATFRAEILKIKSTKNNGTVERYVDEVITILKKKGNKFIKTDVPESVLREFFLKQASEIDPVKEKQKQQAKKKQVLADKKKKEKLIKDTIAPFIEYINKPRYEYVYNLMQEHYIKNLASVDDPTQSSFAYPDERLEYILLFAKEFADYVLIEGAVNPEQVVKKGMEDALREAIMEDVLKRYPEAKAFYQQYYQ